MTFGILLILIVAIYLVFFYPIIKDHKEEPENSNYNRQMKKLWSIAQSSMRERKSLRAEKALLTILKFDEKNAAAYNRLGILYAKEQKYDEAIECFEIAQSLDNNASSLHNAGLIYLETGAYEKAAMAFEQAIKMEGDMPARFIALSKAKEKLGQRKDAIEALESAYALDPSISTLRQILTLHEEAGDTEAVTATTARIEEKMAENAREKAAAAKKTARRRVARPVIRRSAAPKSSATSVTRTAVKAQRPTPRAARPTIKTARTSIKPVSRPSARKIAPGRSIKRKMI